MTSTPWTYPSTLWDISSASYACAEFHVWSCVSLAQDISHLGATAPVKDPLWVYLEKWANQVAPVCTMICYGHCTFAVCLRTQPFIILCLEINIQLRGEQKKEINGQE